VQPALLDSTVYISAMRRGEDGALALARLTAGFTLWLSAVVLEELYAGARAEDRHVVELLEGRLARAHRIVVPNLSDWIESGKTLALVAANYGYKTIGRSRLTNDALIAVSAARLGILVITENQRDFSRLAEFHSFSWRLEEL
jgi:predicted nucleic acid-binding protein